MKSKPFVKTWLILHSKGEPLTYYTMLMINLAFQVLTVCDPGPGEVVSVEAAAEYAPLYLSEVCLKGTK